MNIILGVITTLLMLVGSWSFTRGTEFRVSRLEDWVMSFVYYAMIGGVWYTLPLAWMQGRLANAGGCVIVILFGFCAVVTGNFTTEDQLDKRDRYRR